MKKNNLSAFIIVIFFLLIIQGCNPSPPNGVEPLSFIKNESVKDKFIYQAQAEGKFTEAGKSSLYWTGIRGFGYPAHRLFLTLSGSVKGMTFKLRYPRSGKEITCTSQVNEYMTECRIPVQLLKEKEFVVEVFSPRDAQGGLNARYLLFTGIEGPFELDFYKK